MTMIINKRLIIFIIVINLSIIIKAENIFRKWNNSREYNGIEGVDTKCEWKTVNNNNIEMCIRPYSDYVSNEIRIKGLIVSVYYDTIAFVIKLLLLILTLLLLLLLLLF
jgi:hypothetical protein